MKRTTGGNACQDQHPTQRDGRAPRSTAAPAQSFLRLLGRPLSELLGLQELARRRPLEARELADYGLLRTDLARVLFAFLHGAAASLGETTRRSVRVVERLPVHVRFQDDVLRGPLSTIDVSDGGFATELGHPVEVGEGVHVRLDLPAGEPILAHARAVHAKGLPQGRVQVGFEFLELEAAHAERLRELVLQALLRRLR